jgi:hypothetical protein
VDMGATKCEDCKRDVDELTSRASGGNRKEVEGIPRSARGATRDNRKATRWPLSR